MGGGDEGVVARYLLNGTFWQPYQYAIACAVVMVMALPPIIASFRAVKNNGGWLYNIGFMVLPLIVLGGYGFVLLNGLLAKGFLAGVWIMGTPLFITLHTLVVLILLLLMRRHLFTLSYDNSRMLPLI
jgi:hypothetical protein